MSTNEVQVNAAKRDVLEYFNEKLMYQYKKDSWQNNISKAVGNMLADLHYKAVVTATAKADVENEEKYKGFIKHPSTGLGIRLKFLFTGKF